MLKIAIIIGSTRPERKCPAVAQWVLEHAQNRPQATYELIDLKEVDLPFLDEPAPPSLRKYTHDHTRAWSAKITGYDGFIFVTPEYNHSFSAALKNAIDFLFHEWNHKAAGFVSYGSVGGVRAVEQLRLVMGELKVADTREQVALSLATDFVEYAQFKPAPYHAKKLETVFNEVELWATALRPLRQTSATH